MAPTNQILYMGNVYICYNIPCIECDQWRVIFNSFLYHCRGARSGEAGGAPWFWLLLCLPPFSPASAPCFLCPPLTFVLCWQALTPFQPQDTEAHLAVRVSRDTDFPASPVKWGGGRGHHILELSKYGVFFLNRHLDQCPVLNCIISDGKIPVVINGNKTELQTICTDRIQLCLTTAYFVSVTAGPDFNIGNIQRQIATNCF